MDSPEEPPPREEGQSWSELLQRLTGIDTTLCPVCHQGHLKLRRELPAERRAATAPP